MSDYGLPPVDDWWPAAPTGPQRGGAAATRRGSARRRARRTPQLVAGGGRAGAAASRILGSAAKLARGLGPVGAIAARAIPYVGWATTIGLGIYELQNALLGNQVEATKNASNVQALLDAQQRRFDQELAAERNRQNARDVAAAYVRGLTESAAKMPPAPPPAPAVAPSLGVGTVTLPPLTTKAKIAKALTTAMASPIFLPVLGAVIAKFTAPGSSSSAPPAEDLPPDEFPLTDFQEGPVEFLGGQLGGLDPNLLPQESVSEVSDQCEEIDPERTPGECRQGWFSETPTKLFLQEWSRRPCQ